MKKALDYSAASMSQLEAWAKHPRGPEDAKKIRDERRARGASRKDTGTMSLFGQSKVALAAGQCAQEHRQAADATRTQ